jgi:hypothetical protein
MEALTRGRLNATDVLKDNRNLQLWMFSARHRVIRDQGKLHANMSKFIQDFLFVFQELMYQELNIILKVKYI